MFAVGLMSSQSVFPDIISSRGQQDTFHTAILHSMCSTNAAHEQPTIAAIDRGCTPTGSPRVPPGP